MYLLNLIYTRKYKEGLFVQRRMTSQDIRKITYLAMLTALVVVLQFAGSFIKLGMFSITLVLVPIVVGAAVCGPLSGAWLGFIFGIVVLASGDAAAFLTINAIGTIITVIAKGTLSGLAAGLVYKLIEKKNKYVAVFTSAVICPVVNTGVFLLGCLLFFMDTINEWAISFGYESAGAYMILGLAGGNFLFELLFNILLGPAIVTIIGLAPNLMKTKKSKKKEPSAEPKSDSFTCPYCGTSRKQGDGACPNCGAK